MNKLLLFCMCMTFVHNIFCSSLEPINVHFQVSTQEIFTHNPPRSAPYPAKPIVIDPQDQMLAEFDELIYENNVPAMRQILVDPEAFTHKYQLPCATAEQLVNMKRKNTGNMSLHIVAARAYKDLTMAELLIEYGANAKACNAHGWLPLVHPSNINFSRYLLAQYFSLFPVLPDFQQARAFAVLYKNKEKIKMLDDVAHLQNKFEKIDARYNARKKMSQSALFRCCLQFCSQKNDANLKKHALVCSKEYIQDSIKNEQEYAYPCSLLKLKIDAYAQNLLEIISEEITACDEDNDNQPLIESASCCS